MTILLFHRHKLVKTVLFISGQILLFSACSTPTLTLSTITPEAVSPTIGIVETEEPTAENRNDTPELIIETEPPTLEPTLIPNEILTQVPVEDIEDLPEHAATITPQAAVTDPASQGTLSPDDIAGNLTPADSPTINTSGIEIPSAAVKIYRPGNLSRVASPFRVVANLAPDINGQVKVELVGEDGRIIVRKILYLTVLPGYKTGNLLTDIEFEISTVAEAARLEISVNDEFGRPKELNSVELILVSSGKSDILGYGDLQSDIVVQQPFSNYMIQGESLIVSGLARTGIEKPMQIEIIDEGGRVVATGLGWIIEQENTDYGFFVSTITYIVNSPTWVRLIISMSGSRIPGTGYLTSLEIVLGP